jgi:hypothetical protein
LEKRGLRKVFEKARFPKFSFEKAQLAKCFWKSVVCDFYFKKRSLRFFLKKRSLPKFTKIF